MTTVATETSSVQKKVENGLRDLLRLCDETDDNFAVALYAARRDHEATRPGCAEVTQEDIEVAHRATLTGGDVVRAALIGLLGVARALRASTPDVTFVDVSWFDYEDDWDEERPPPPACLGAVYRGYRDAGLELLPVDDDWLGQHCCYGFFCLVRRNEETWSPYVETVGVDLEGRWVGRLDVERALRIVLAGETDGQGT